MFSMYNNKIKKYLIVFLSTVLSLIVMIFCGVSYETNDDWAMAWQLSGREDGLASFLSPILSTIISFFYRYKEISWWLLFSLFCIACCLFTIYFLFSEIYHSKNRYVILSFCAICVWISSIVTMNFTRTAMLLGICGCLWIYSFWKYNRKIELFFGVVLIIVGAMVRYQAVIVIIPILIIHGLFEYIADKIKIKKISIAIGIVCILIVTLGIADGVFWKNHPQWQQYLKYNSIRSQIQDYSDKFPEWDNSKKEYEKIGLEKGDEKMLLEEWFSEDINVYSSSNMKKILKIKDTKINIVDSVKEVVGLILNNSIGLLNFIVCVMIFLKCIRLRKIEILVIYTYILSTFTFFSLRGRILERVSEPLMFAAFLSGIWLLGVHKNERKKDNIFISIKNIDTQKKYRISLSVFCSVIIGAFILGKEISVISTTFQIPHFYNGINNNARQEMDYMNGNPDKIYILPATAHNWNQSFGIWERIHKDYCNNVFFLGGWEARAPYNVERLKNYNIENPAYSLVEKSNVYSAYDENVWDFLRRHYGKEITCSRVDSFHGEYDNSVVAYTNTVKKGDLLEKENINKIISVEQFENQVLDDMQGKLISGTISCKDIKDLYLNVEVKSKTYTYRLNLNEDGTFNAFLYDYDRIFENQLESKYFWGKEKSGKNVYLGDSGL